MANLERSKPIGETNREAIEHYLVSPEGSVQINDVQRELLTRWEFADEHIRRHEIRRADLAKLIVMRFKVSRVTAYQDIVNAENVFASSSPLNKRYRIALRIELLEMKITELYNMCRFEPTDEAGNPLDEEEAAQEDVLEKVARIKNNQEYLHEAKELEKVLQKYYQDYPDILPRRSPKTIIYNIQYNSLPAPQLTPDEAMDLHKKTIYLKPNDTGSEQ